MTAKHATLEYCRNWMSWMGRLWHLSVPGDSKRLIVTTCPLFIMLNVAALCFPKINLISLAVFACVFRNIMIKNIRSGGGFAVIRMLPVSSDNLSKSYWAQIVVLPTFLLIFYAFIVWAGLQSLLYTNHLYIPFIMVGIPLVLVEIYILIKTSNKESLLLDILVHYLLISFLLALCFLSSIFFFFNASFLTNNSFAEWYSSVGTTSTLPLFVLECFFIMHLMNLWFYLPSFTKTTHFFRLLQQTRNHPQQWKKVTLGTLVIGIFTALLIILIKSDFLLTTLTAAVVILYCLYQLMTKASMKILLGLLYLGVFFMFIVLMVGGVYLSYTDRIPLITLSPVSATVFGIGGIACMMGSYRFRYTGIRIYMKDYIHPLNSLDDDTNADPKIYTPLPLYNPRYPYWLTQILHMAWPGLVIIWLIIICVCSVSTTFFGHIADYVRVFIVGSIISGGFKLDVQHLPVLRLLPFEENEIAVILFIHSEVFYYAGILPLLLLMAVFVPSHRDASFYVFGAFTCLAEARLFSDILAVRKNSNLAEYAINVKYDFKKYIPYLAPFFLYCTYSTSEESLAYYLSSPWVCLFFLIPLPYIVRMAHRDLVYRIRHDDAIQKHKPVVQSSQ